MLKANFNRAFFSTLSLTLFLLVGCSTPEEKKSDQINAALEFSQRGEYAAALGILESLIAQYPNDLEILTSMGQVYFEEGDHTMAAFFLEQAHLQAPQDAELLFQAYRSLRAAEQPAGHLLEKLAEQAPEAMDGALWLRLGQNRESANRIQPALNAYLRSTETEPASAETAAAIGQLYILIGNLAQAEAWLERAADNDDPNALTALFGLLEIKLRQKDWPGAEATLAQLDRQFPGAVEASQWDEARQELIRWREAQDAMQAKLARAKTEKQAAQARAEAEARAAAEKEAETESEIPSSSASSRAADTLSASSEPAATNPWGDEAGGKAQVITDLEAAEAMANMPAIETPADGSRSGSGAATRNGIRFNRSIAIEPADPDISFTVDFDQAPLADPTSYGVKTSELMQPSLPARLPAPLELNEAADLGGALGSGATATGRSERPLGGAGARPAPPSGPKSIEELLADAELAERDRDFKAAIRKYWAAISISNQRADVWNLLSRAYLIDGQLGNAETSALEAVRLAPREVAFTLDYLRVAQRSKTADAFLSDLETAYSRFPGSPEITLSLARAHERISGETETARSLYRRFIDIAPKHPLVPEARAAVDRL